MTGRFVHVRRPWTAVVDLSSPEPAQFLVSLAGQALRYGRPAARRGGRLRGLAVRVGLPERAAARALRAARPLTRGDVSVEAELDALVAAWPALRQRDHGLPARPPVSALRLHRSAAVTTFYFGTGLPPLVVGKRATGDDGALRCEAEALRHAAALDAGPLPLGDVPGVGALQRGVPGRALRVVPVTPRSAHRTAWTSAHRDLAELLERMAAATASDRPCESVTDDVVAAGLRWSLVPAELRCAVRDALDAIAARPRSVLQHIDTSPQNVLVAEDGSCRLVDWEMARMDGAPGADAWAAGLAYLEHGCGLVGWREEDLLEVFRRTWGRSGFGVAWRESGRRAARAAGVPEDLLDAHELVWAARRTGYRVLRPDEYPTSAELALRQLAHVHAVQRGRPAGTCV